MTPDEQLDNLARILASTADGFVFTGPIPPKESLIEYVQSWYPELEIVDAEAEMVGDEMHIMASARPPADLKYITVTFSTIAWWSLNRNIESDWQDGVERDIDDYIHIFGCTRDQWCFYNGVVSCDCTCHNGEPNTIEGLINA